MIRIFPQLNSFFPPDGCTPKKSFQKMRSLALSVQQTVAKIFRCLFPCFFRRATEKPSSSPICHTGGLPPVQPPSAPLQSSILPAPACQISEGAALRNASSLVATPPIDLAPSPNFSQLPPSSLPVPESKPTEPSAPAVSAVSPIPPSMPPVGAAPPALPTSTPSPCTAALVLAASPLTPPSAIAPLLNSPLAAPFPPSAPPVGSLMLSSGSSTHPADQSQANATAADLLLRRDSSSLSDLPRLTMSCPHPKKKPTCSVVPVPAIPNLDRESSDGSDLPQLTMNYPPIKLHQAPPQAKLAPESPDPNIDFSTLIVAKATAKPRNFDGAKKLNKMAIAIDPANAFVGLIPPPKDRGMHQGQHQYRPLAADGEAEPERAIKQAFRLPRKRPLKQAQIALRSKTIARGMLNILNLKLSSEAPFFIVLEGLQTLGPMIRSGRKIDAAVLTGIFQRIKDAKDDDENLFSRLQETQLLETLAYRALQTDATSADPTLSLPDFPDDDPPLSNLSKLEALAFTLQGTARELKLDLLGAVFILGTQKAPKAFGVLIHEQENSHHFYLLNPYGEQNKDGISLKRFETTGTFRTHLNEIVPNSNSEKNLYRIWPLVVKKN